MTAYNVIREERDGTGAADGVSVSVRTFYGEDDARRYVAEKWGRVAKPAYAKPLDGPVDAKWADIDFILLTDGVIHGGFRKWAVGGSAGRIVSKWTISPCDVTTYGGVVVPFDQWSRDFLLEIWPHAIRTVVEECRFPDTSDLTRLAVRFSRRYRGSYVQIADAATLALRYGGNVKDGARFDLDRNLVVYGVEEDEGDNVREEPCGSDEGRIMEEMERLAGRMDRPNAMPEAVDVQGD